MAWICALIELELTRAGLQRALGRVPSAVFAQSAPGAPRYQASERLACLGVKFLEYSLAGMVCGFVGQGLANGLMHLKCGTGHALARVQHLAGLQS